VASEEEQDLTPEELRAVGKGNRKPLLIIALAGLAGVAALWLLLKSSDRPQQPIPTAHEQRPALTVAEHDVDLGSVTGDTLASALPNDTAEPIDLDAGHDLAIADSVPQEDLPSNLPESDFVKMLKADVSDEELLAIPTGEEDALLAAHLEGVPTALYGLHSATSDSEGIIQFIPVDSSVIIQTALAAYKDSVAQVLDTTMRAGSEARAALEQLSGANRQLSDRLARVAAKVDSARAAEVKRLAKIIESMRPAAAAQMLAERSPDEVSEILFKVKPRAAALILQEMAPSQSSGVAARVVRK